MSSSTSGGLTTHELGRLAAFVGDLPDVLAKYLFGYPAGKAQLAPKLVKLIADHEVYSEPFCGSAAVFIAKAAAKTEVLNDRSDKLVSVLRDVGELTEPEIGELKKRDWLGNGSLYKKIAGSNPNSRVERVYRSCYLARFSQFRDPWSRAPAFDESHSGRLARTPARIEHAAKRLANAKFYVGDYEVPTKKYDGRGTLHFFDPPYVGYDGVVGEREFDEERFASVLKNVEGRFLMTYGMRGKLDVSKFRVRKLRTRENNLSPSLQRLPTLLVSNYELALKSLEDEYVVEDGGLVEIDDELAREFGVAGATAREIAKRVGAVPGLGTYAAELEIFGQLLEKNMIQRCPQPLEVPSDISEALECLFDVAFDLEGRAPDLAPNPQFLLERSRELFGTKCSVVVNQKSSSAARIGKMLVDPGQAVEFVEIDPCAEPTHQYQQALGGNFVIVAPDCDNAREELGKIATGLFKLRGDERLYATNVLLDDTDDRAYWIGLPIAKAPYLADQCMRCEQSPTYECLWADGRARAWFCDEHWAEFQKEHDDIVQSREVVGGAVGRFYGQAAKNEKADSTTVQTVIFSKEKFSSAGDCAKWLRDHDFKAPGVDETDSSYRFRQRDPGSFQPGSFRTIELTSGIKAVVGRLKDGKQASVVEKALEREIPIFKAGEERFVLGIVLEPETVDAQNDIYSAEEVRQAAHKFMSDFQNVGLMHQKLVNKGVQIVESYIAPTDFKVGEQYVKAGTWVLAVKVVDERMWGDVKTGKLTGFSIGGSAIRAPDERAA